MKIKPTFNKNQISDELSINGNDLTINRATFPLDNLKTAPESLEESETVTAEMIEARQIEITQFNIDNPVRLENGEPVCYISVAMNRNFLFMNRNFLIMHGIDLDNVSRGDLVVVADCYNHENDIRIEEHRQVITEFCLKSVSESNQDKSREFYNIRTPGTLRANYTRTLNQFIADNGLDEVFKSEVITGYESWLKHVEDCMKVK